RRPARHGEHELRVRKCPAPLHPRAPIGRIMTTLDNPRDDATAALPWFISVDDHVIEPPDVWTSRVPAKYRDAAPRYERQRVGRTFAGGSAAFVTEVNDDGEATGGWGYGDVVRAVCSSGAGAGVDRMDMGLGAISFEEMRPDCYEAAARVADMELNH